MPIVSVIVPVYNTMQWLAECVESIREQTLQDIEIILIDDGLFFASTFWKKLQNVFGEFCISILENIADAPAACYDCRIHCFHRVIVYSNSSG